jgi:CheY-like chemotaxis protein
MSLSDTVPLPVNLERINVLIVEDERISRQALAALMAASGYDTEAMASGEEALEAVRLGSHPDIVLVDLDLPGMNGFDFIGELRQVEPNVFPVLITAANAESVLQTVQQRGLAYLPKPLDFATLLELLSKHSLN